MITMRQIAHALNQTPDEFLDQDATDFVKNIFALTELLEAELAIRTADGDA